MKLNKYVILNQKDQYCLAYCEEIEPPDYEKRNGYVIVRTPVNGFENKNYLISDYFKDHFCDKALP